MLGLRLDDKFRGIRQLGARRALNILSAINLINFADRYVPSAVKTLIEADLKINDFQSSLPTTGMIIVYMIFAMIFGILSDKQLVRRTYFSSMLTFSLTRQNDNLDGSKDYFMWCNYFLEYSYCFGGAVQKSCSVGCSSFSCRCG